MQRHSIEGCSKSIRTVQTTISAVSKRQPRSKSDFGPIHVKRRVQRAVVDSVCTDAGAVQDKRIVDATEQYELKNAKRP